MKPQPRFYVFFAVGILGLVISTLARTANNNHPSPRLQEHSAYFPQGGELYPASQIVMSRLEDGRRVQFADIKVSVERFRRIVAENPGISSVVVVSGTDGDPKSWESSAVIHYWLWRDGFYYHATGGLPKIHWGSYDTFFTTVWEYKTGETWVASALWMEETVLFWIWLGGLFMLIGFGFDVSALAWALLRRFMPTEA